MSADRSNAQPRRPKVRWTRRARVLGAVLGFVMAGGTAYAVTNWAVGLSGGSSGQGQSAAISNLTISASSSPAAANLLYPGATGDVVVSIANPNAFPVTITAVNLPTSSTYATGYTNAALSTANSSCTASTSQVSWNYATGTSGSSHTLTTPLIVGASGQANNPLVVTLTNDATMTTASPAACANTYFAMPALTAISASGGVATSTATPATDSWTS